MPLSGSPGIDTVEAIDNLVRTVLPGESLSERHRTWLADLIDPPPPPIQHPHREPPGLSASVTSRANQPHRGPHTRRSALMSTGLPTFTVRNLGPIAHGTVQLRPLTILIGQDNSGKTYMAQAVYGRVQGPPTGQRLPRPAADPSGGLPARVSAASSQHRTRRRRSRPHNTETPKLDA